MKHNIKVTTTFDNSISYVQNLSAAKWLIKEEVYKGIHRKDEFKITKI